MQRHQIPFHDDTPSWDGMSIYDTPAVDIRERILTLLADMVASRPNDCSERNRAWSIGITEMQKTIAWWQMYCVDRLDQE